MAISGAIISVPNWVENSLEAYNYNVKIFVGFSNYESNNGEHEYL